MPLETSFVGRAHELHVLDDLLTAVDERRSRAVEIVGPAGIGKSRLLAALAERAERRGHLVLAGSGAELEQDLPFWVFADALDAYVEALEPRRWERLGPAVRGDLGQILPAVAAHEGSAPGATHERHRAHRAMRLLLEHLATATPLVLVLDDFHWADPASIDLLVALLHRPPRAGVLLALAARPAQLPTRLAAALDRAHRSGDLERLALGELSLDEARSLVGARADELFAEAGGNPFYLEHLARVAADRVPAAPGGDVTLGGVDVPPMVAAALREELLLLGEAERAVLDGAAAAGDPFDIDHAAAAAGMDEPAALAALDELVRLDLVRPGDAPRRFRFRHPIVRRAVYEATPSGWRIGAHARVAALLAQRGAPATARAHHVERSAAEGDLDAVAVLREAAGETRLRAPATAARWFESAARLLPSGADPAERVELLLAAAEGLTATGRFARSHDLLLGCLRALPPGPGALRTRVATACARVEHLLGRHEQAHERLIAALDELPDERSSDGVALMIELTLDGLHRMSYAAMRSWGARAASAARDLDDDALRAAALAVAARAAAVPGATVEAERLRSEAAALVDALSDDVLARRLDASTYLAGAELYLQRFADARRHGERTLRVARATGQGQQFPHVLGLLATCTYVQGRLADAVEVVDAGIDAARLTGAAQPLGWALYARSRLALALGDVELALSTAQEAVDVTDDGTPSHHHSHAAFALAEAWLELGKPERAIGLLEASTGGAELPLAAASFRALFLEALLRARLALDDRDGARRAVDAAAENAAATALPLSAAWADRSAARLALRDGDPGRAAALATAAAERFEEREAPIEAAISWTVVGTALALAGDREGAVARLAPAAAQLDACGAVRHRDRAERELRRLGQRVRRRPTPAAGEGEGAVASLTARELEIARLIVDRRTNRQIAEALLLSPKTVETHIRNIFGKLGAGSRVEVAQIVERADRLSRTGGATR